jgi:hypothetical protein
MCAFIMYAIKQNGLLRALRSIEQRLMAVYQGLPARAQQDCIWMKVAFAKGRRTDVMMQFFCPDRLLHGFSHPQPLLSLDMWGRSKSREPSFE